MMNEKRSKQQCIKFLLEYCSNQSKKHESHFTASNLNPEAKVFELKGEDKKSLNPGAAIFVPKVEQEQVPSDVTITVTSTLFRDLIAKYRISKESPKLSLMDVQKHFPSAVGMLCYGCSSSRYKLLTFIAFKTCSTWKWPRMEETSSCQSRNVSILTLLVLLMFGSRFLFIIKVASSMLFTNR